MRLKNREIPREDALRAADESLWAILSMIDPSGMPYSTPISIARDGETIYFHCATEGYKLECMRAHPEVCLSCVSDAESVAGALTMAYCSATVRGTAQEVLDVKEKVHALVLISEKFDPASIHRMHDSIERNVGHTGIWKIIISNITGKQKKVPQKDS